MDAFTTFTTATATPVSSCPHAVVSTSSRLSCLRPVRSHQHQQHHLPRSPREIVSSLQDSVQRIASRIHVSPTLRNAAFFAMNALVALPSLAEEVIGEEVREKGKIFDFNLTLPVIAVEFLLLMVALDNIWFKPVSKFMDDRDEYIRQKLLGVRDNSDDIKQLQVEAEAIIKAARAETTAELNKMKRETAAALDEKLQESRERIEKELAAALTNLEAQKEETLKSLDKQVLALSEQIIEKVIPFKI